MRIRNDLFSKMESLPIRYFDKHTHGELMSLYTNDTDAIREMLSNSVAQFISSAITIVGVFTAMLIYSWQLTIIVVIMLFIIVKVIGAIGSRSGKGFIAQQKAIGAVNGYIEEMIDGQKVVKVFTHEDKTCEEFEKLNGELCEAATRANTFANILMPIMNNLSYLHYAVTAIAGGIMTVKGIGGMTIGTVVSYLQFTRQFSQPITQVSQQLNSVLTALAGAERIFKVIDEDPEEDNGYVTLVNANIAPDGTITESAERTGRWAWKHPHKADGTVTYTEVKGKVEFDEVVFGYEPNKTVLNGISLYAKSGQKIAFVGSTGAGKTTITNLINRFYDVPDGKIRYDGININKIKKDDLRRSQSIVLQDTHLFTRNGYGYTDTASLMQLMRKYTQQQSLLMPTALSVILKTVMILCLRPTEQILVRDSVSFSLLQEPLLLIRLYLFLMRQQALLIHEQNRLSKRVWTVLWREERYSLLLTDFRLSAILTLLWFLNKEK